MKGRWLAAALLTVLLILTLTSASTAVELPVIDVKDTQDVIGDTPIEPLATLPVRPDPPLSQLAVLPTSIVLSRPRAGEFLRAGEYCYQDWANGEFVYVSATTHVRLEKFTSDVPLLTWHEAEVWVQGGELLHTEGYIDGERSRSHTTDLYKIALDKKLVVGISTDFVHTRREWGTNAGVMIREGMVLNDRTYSAGHIKYPNNDNLALLKDGEMHVYPNATYNAQDFLDMGAYDVFSFGPVLVKDGAANSDVIRKLTKESAQRIAAGVFEKNHYLLVMCEGRHSGSRGATLTQLADIFVNRGVREAFNMDGGQSSVMVFMGRQVFHTSLKQKARRGCELLAVGTSELVGRE